METINHFNYLSYSTKIALYSFGIGTAIFLLHLISPSQNVLLLGLFFVLFALLFNGIVFLNLIYTLITDSENREQTVIQILILLANIPIAALYFFLVVRGESFI